MPEAESERYILAALDFCNEVRAYHNLPKLDELVPGRRKVCRECPIARTIAWGSDFSEVTSGRYSVRIYFPALNYREHQLSAVAGLFVERFDRGMYGWLEA